VILGLDSYTTEWLNLLGRWLHVIAAIAWVGSSFYFIALDNHLEPAADERSAAAGVGGEAWEILGGGFYDVQKYRVAPTRLPERLLWFKWEAYTTWLSGFALFIVLYYAKAGSYLIDKSVADLSTAAAVLISIGLLGAAWVVYDALCRLLGARELVIAAAVLGLTTLAAWGSEQLFAPRAAYIQVGGMRGTIMAATVFFVIIPAHWELVRAKEAGREPDPRYNFRGKQRSVHNNYLTLPVVFTMISNHFPSVFGHSYAWLVLVALMVIGAAVRHYFNLRHTGRNHWWILAAAAAGIAAVAVLIRPGGSAQPAESPSAAAAGKRVFQTGGCASCHTLRDAGSHGTVGPNLDAAKPSRSLVVERVTNGQGAMPPFRGRLTDAQIAAVADYVSSAAGR
jgi:uncharacterized membrane protein